VVTGKVDVRHLAAHPKGKWRKRRKRGTKT
jgi:hypothetical protein